MNKILRAPWHDYTQRCIYMVTFNKGPHAEVFGFLEGDYRIPIGQKGSSYIWPQGPAARSKKFFGSSISSSLKSGSYSTR